MRRTSIIIPTYNALELIQQAVSAIRLYTDESETPYELVVVDNGSTDGTCEWCVQERINLISLPGNTGFPTACNKGMRIASGECLLLLNNDVTVSRGWLSGLQRALDSSPEVGMVGPVTNYASGKQQVGFEVPEGNGFHGVAAQVARQRQGQVEPLLRLVGFCLLMKRELYERIGELDERFSPGHYEDDDYCLRARMNGFSLLMSHDVLVYHQGSASFKRDGLQELQQLVERNRQRFVEKWQIDPMIFI
ncbi:glycosyltransferase family 2 protein [Paenibacillus oenotherae]|uniref:Glycosyltransferase family 2 protein n=1 Tax=Paenibacillus oenotherae TaxID=1435645 RepID=A0ABS7D3K4_9BACL|nr:glycosyltransferase family 2 protein [Paenibacillus oenotherae]MBW7474514.1 glycosyltransferase family 2 protein [Paenibacillus oenotherae]